MTEKFELDKIVMGIVIGVILGFIICLVFYKPSVKVIDSEERYNRFDSFMMDILFESDSYTIFGHTITNNVTVAVLKSWYIAGRIQSPSKMYIKEKLDMVCGG